MVTSFHPGEGLRDLIAATRGQVARIVVIDNTPSGYEGADSVVGTAHDLIIRRNGTNEGLGAALNRGIREVGDAEFVFLLDQDSVPPAGIVAGLGALLDADPEIAIAAPAPWDPAHQRYLDPRASRRPSIAALPVVITSAMLLRRAAFDQTAGMRSDFFVDCVDQDICLQLGRLGWRVVQDRRWRLPHSLGSTRWHGIGALRLRATHHPTWRLYWAARNGVILSREHRRDARGWSLMNLVLLAYWAGTVLLFEPPRIVRLRTMAHGLLDGLRGRRDVHQLPT
ncbi:glycosyltransferase [Pseudolysinimonas sp.]|uniref:glycosyltransferase n=1 Tax=Pseudolysinimonas sp. TaxID=2680009 RepID=UPI003F7DF622